MKWTFKIFFIIVLLNGFVSFSQTESKPSVLSFEGQVAVTTDGKAIFVNVGGPAIKLGFSKIAFAINMFPSLKIEVENRKTPVFPLLGVGPQIYFLKNKKTKLRICSSHQFVPLHCMAWYFDSRCARACFASSSMSCARCASCRSLSCGPSRYGSRRRRRSSCRWPCARSSNSSTLTPRSCCWLSVLARG